jgi:hypothetical protein
VFTPPATRPAQPMYSPLHPGGGRAGFGLPGLIQRRDHQLVPGQVLGHVSPYHARHPVGVPHGVVEQPLGLLWAEVPDLLGDGPAVLTRQVAHQRADVLACLLKRLDPAEAWRQPAV